MDEEIEDDLEPSLELLRLVEQEAKEIRSHEEMTEVINLGIEEEKKEVKIDKLMKGSKRHKLIKLLQEYRDVFFLVISRYARS